MLDKHNVKKILLSYGNKGFKIFFWWVSGSVSPHFLPPYPPRNVNIPPYMVLNTTIKYTKYHHLMSDNL